MTVQLDAAQAETVAAEVAADLGCDPPPQLLRSGRNHVFRAGDVVLRLAPPPADGQAHVRLARWLLDEGFPVARPLHDAAFVGGAVVTVWEHVEPAPGVPTDYEQLGGIIARLHRIAPSRLPAGIELPWCGWADWLQLEPLLEAAAAGGVVGVAGIAALTEEYRALQDWQTAARDEPGVVCHGDVIPQNVLMRGDEVVLLDWDNLCLGPPAWDHAALLTWEDRWSGRPGTYRDFAAGYGADLAGSELARTLARVRLLAPTLNMVVRGADSPRRAAEARRRLRYWLGDPDAPPWRAQ